MAKQATRLSDQARVSLLDGKVDPRGIVWYLCEIPGEGRAWIMDTDLAIDAD